MPSILSTLAGSYSCHETIHPWTPHCSEAGLDLLSVVFFKCLKLYGPLSLVQHVVENRSITTGLTELAKDTLHSATFVSSQVYLSFTFICLLRHFRGSINLFSIYSSVVAASLCICSFGSRTKIDTITILLVKASVEAFYKLLNNPGESIGPVSRKKNALFIFTFSSCLSVSLFMAKQSGYKKDPLSKLLKVIFGTSEEAKGEDAMATDDICPHDTSCAIYVLSGFVKPFVLGYGWMTVLEVARHPFRAIKNNLSILVDQKSLKFGLFLASMTSSYRLMMCLQRKKEGKDSATHALRAGLVSGMSMALFPSSQLTMFMFWKTLFSLYWTVVKSSKWPYSNQFVNGLFSLSSATVILLYLTKPDCLPKSYVKACDKVLPKRFVNGEIIKSVLT